VTTTPRPTRWHPAWTVAAVTLGALVAAAAFRSSTGVLMEPIEDEFGWDRTTTSGAVSLNLVLFGLVAPFAAALMDRWGVRRVVTLALGLVGLASAATTVMTDPWHLWLLWGLVIGTATGMMALVFGAIVANRWFVRHRGLVMGIFSAGNATGQLVFLPIIAAAAAGPGWRVAALTVAGLALAVMVAVAFLLHEHPHDVDLKPLGADDDYVVPVSPHAEQPVRAAIRVLRDSSRSWTFWALMATFFVCGWSTNGLIQTHFVPAAHDHGMATTTAAGLLALVGIFDIIGTVASGWLTDRMDPRILLAVYYAFRGLSLFTLHSLLAPQVEPQLWVFIVFYGLDWVATVPPTVALCREHFGLHDSGIVFGWTFASHMVGAGIGASFAGWIRSTNGSYEIAWYAAGVLCLIAAGVAMTIRKQPAVEPERVPVSA
jgi:MFS family permease